MSWFEDFKRSMTGHAPSSDLVGAKNTSAVVAMAHYRYQHQSKIRDAINETFPQTMKMLGKESENFWISFWESKPASPRSLDFFGEIFLAYVLASPAPLMIKEMARFEWAMEIHPWTHEKLKVLPLPSLNEETRIKTASLDIQSFVVNVTNRYQDEAVIDDSPQKVILWMKESGVHFRSISDWEENVLRALPQGLGQALELAPDDESLVSEFFQWLGSSGLIRP